jgi:hypothetical protein
MSRFPSRRSPAAACRRRPASPRSRPRLEALEDRLNPAPTFTVTNLLDGGAGSLRNAIAMANAAGAATIDFASGLNGTIQLTSAELQIMSNLRIDTSVSAGTGLHQITVKAPVAGGRDFDVLGGWQVAFVGDPNGSQAGPTGFIITRGNRVGFGGGINALSPLASIILMGVDVTTNSVTADGGGVEDLGTLGLYRTTVESNTAGGNGGGTSAGDAFVAYDSLITNNKAGGGGGGAYDSGPGSTMLFDGTTVENNSASKGAGGGALAHYNVVSLASTFTANSAGANGGGISSRDGSVSLQSVLFGTRSFPSTVSVNSAGANGGGVFADHTISVVASDVFGNMAQSSGGGFFSVNGPINLNAATVQINEAITGKGGGAASGGDVFVTNGSFSIDIQGNSSASDGGGIWAAKDVVLTQDATLQSNRSFNGSGGGVWAGGNVQVQDGFLVANSAAKGDGGGIADPSGNIYVTSVLFNMPNVSGSEFSTNSAIDGGAIWDKSGTIEIHDHAFIAGNVASHNGGAIWTAGILHADTSTIQFNKAVHGGGIAAENADEVTLYQTRLVFNQASAPSTDPAAGGGALLHNVADVSISYSTIASNTAASGNGGGIALIADNTTAVTSVASIDDSTFGGFITTTSVNPNLAGGFGGGIYLKNASARILHVTFNDNEAKGTPAGRAGSAIYADVGVVVRLEDTLVDDTDGFANPFLTPGSSLLLGAAAPGEIQSAGHNLVHDGSWAIVSNFNPLNGDIRNGHQALGALEFNQAFPPGPTFTETYRLLGQPPDEQAIGGGDDLGPTRDQNGRLRPAGAPSDIGSTQAF